MKKLHCLIWAVIISVLVECTVFQYKFFGSLGYEPCEDSILRIYEGGEWNDDGSITVTDTFKLEIAEINSKVHALKLNFRRYNEQGVEKNQGTEVTPYAMDEANGDYFKMKERVIFADNPQSQYLRFHLSGDCKSMVFIFSAAEGDRIYIDEVIVNPHIPFDFSLLRCVLLFGTLVLCIYANPRAAHYNVLYDGRRSQRRITLLVMIVQLAVFCGAVFLNPVIYKAEFRHHAQYHELAVALSKGQLYLEEMPSPVLGTMENPYDFVTRDKVMEETGENYIWDCAYYNGKYYVYFGVLPVMVFYLPWYLITGTAFPTWLGIMLTGIVFVFAAFLLSDRVVRKYFQGRVPYVAWLLTTVLAVNGCGVIMMMRRPDFYYLPILMGITLSLLGLNFWISSLRENGVCAIRLVAGCLCMALVAACRPQLLLGSLLIFPIYWDAVFKKRWLFSRKSLGKTILACMAYGVVALLLMIYNDRRFGSPFDFGAAYNLTTNDMTRRGMVPARIPSAIFRCLFQPPRLSARFPYLEMTDGWSSYLGKVISEGTYGGFLTVNLLPLVGVLLMRKKHWFAEKKLWAAAIISFMSGVVILCLNAQLAGVLLRYFTDFGWLMYLSGLLVWFAAWQHNEGKGERIYLLRLATNLMFCVGMAYAFLIIFVDTSDSLSYSNPSLFYEFYHQLAFWS